MDNRETDKWKNRQKNSILLKTCGDYLRTQLWTTDKNTNGTHR
jgi:hypothetical protein